jgi:cell filamentation protein
MLDKYGTGQDPYCYTDSSVLINKLGISDETTLQAAESEIARAAARDIPFDKPPYEFGYLLPSRSKNAYFESYKISAKPREIKACGILQSGRFMSEKGVKTIHFRLFSRIYEWAGRIRTIDLSKGNTRFCTVARIQPEADKIFQRLAAENFFVGYSKDKLITKLAELYGDLNMIHPFREGNGRAQRLLFEHISFNCDYELDWGMTSKDEWTEANIRSVYCDFRPLENIFHRALSELK